MPVRKRSPLRVRCRTLAFGLKSCEWICDRPIRGAQFESRTKGDGRYAIVAPSTKKTGMWQTTTFDAQGPIGDRQHASCDLAVKELPPKRWRLRAVEG